VLSWAKTVEFPCGQRGRDADDDAMRHPTLVPCSRPAASSTVAPAAVRCATRRRPTTTAIAPRASSARRSTTRTRSTSSARCRSGKTRCCSAGARVELEGLYSLINVVRVGQVHLFYRARMLDTDFVPGPESLEAKLVREAEVPWDEIAFRTTKMTL